MNGPVKTIASVCVVSFALGIAAGWWATREDLLPRHLGRQERYQRMLHRFTSQLKLTPEQKTEVEAFLQEKQKKMEELRAQMRPQYEEARRSTQAKIRRLLTPEQQKKFDQMEKDWYSRIKKLY